MLTEKYILECLDKYCNFECLHQDNFFEQVVEPLAANQCFEDWTWDNGVTKGVLIFKHFDYVIKIPFQGECNYYESHYESEGGTWRYDISTASRSRYSFVESVEEFIDFSGAESGENDWDYCAAEKEIAQYAKQRSLEKCFAITELLGYAQEYPIYIQEKCYMFREESTTNEERYKSRTETDYASLRKVREKVKFWGINDDWVLDFLIYWGEDILQKFGQFLDEFNVEDLHCGNIGYRNGVPCLVDYSSFRE